MLLRLYSGKMRHTSSKKREKYSRKVTLKVVHEQILSTFPGLGQVAQQKGSQYRAQTSNN